MDIGRTFGASLLLCVLAGCGTGGEQLVVLPPTAHPATKAAPEPSSASAAPSGGNGKPHVTVQPARGLHDGDTVSVTATGFTAGKTYIVAECGDKGSKTGQGDCDIAAIVPVTADDSGTVRTDMTVKVGPFGANHITCSAAQPCLINVSEPTPNPSEQADARIAFAG